MCQIKHNYVGHGQHIKNFYQKVVHKFSLSQVILQVVPMSKCNHHVTGHTPGRINRNGTVYLLILIKDFELQRQE